MTKPSVAILSYNRRHELKRTLSALIRRRDLWHEIIVADNDSSDGTDEMVGSQFPIVRLIRNGGNFGIIGSNRAYHAATGDWVLSLDDDSAPDANSLESLCKTIDTGENVAAIALSIRRKPIPGIPKHPAVTTSKTYGFSSAGVLFNRRALMQIGTYDPELFLFTNELHWTARALLKGWCLNKADNVFVIHRSSPKNRSHAIHAFLYTRNTLLFLFRYAPASLSQTLATRYFQWAATYSVLHRTVIYLRAIRSAFFLHRHHPEKRCPLDEVTFSMIDPDWRAGFSHLG